MRKNYYKTQLTAVLLAGSVITHAAVQTELADQPIFTKTGVPSNVALALSVEYPTAEELAYTDPRNTDEPYSPNNKYLGYWDPDKCYDYVFPDIFDGDARLYNTGINDNGSLLNEGQKDPHWEIVSWPSSVSPDQRNRLDRRSGRTSFGDEDSEYLGFSYSEAAPGGDYVYRSEPFTFVDDVDPRSVAIRFELFTDDDLINLSVNGVSTGVTAGSKWNQSATVFIPAGTFTQHTNTISLTVENGDNYTGMLIDEVAISLEGDLGVDSQGYFYPRNTTSDRTCDEYENARWSGNFLNYSLTHTIDSMKIALSGGYRTVDSDSVTIMDKGWSTRTDYYWNQSNVVSGAETIAGATPIDASSISVRVNGLGNRFWISPSADSEYKKDDNDLVHVVHDQESIDHLPASTYYELFGRVQVCVSGLEEENCEQYPSGSVKPTGLIQEYDRNLRFAAFGYLNDDDIQRDGGVLRAAMASLGPMYFDVDERKMQPTEAPEWDASTGRFDPNPHDELAAGMGVNHSGVINYLNQFGKDANFYKTHDPVSELYYTALRYLSNQGNVPEYTDNITPLMMDGFPVYTEWDDPVLASCQSNYIIGIGDTNTHRDFDLPGSEHSLKDGPLPEAVVADTIFDVDRSTNRVGDMEGGDNVGLADEDVNSKQGGPDSSFYMAGLAYDARTRDLRSDLEGTQTVRTYWLDVLEDGGDYMNSQPGELHNQFWLAAKYGGFAIEGNGKHDPYVTPAVALEQEWWDKDNDGEPDNYYRADDPQKMMDGLRAAFESIIADGSRPSSALKAESPFIYTSDVVISSSYTAFEPTKDANGNDIVNEWTGEVDAKIIVDFEDDGTPVFDDVWSASDRIKNQNWNTGRHIVTARCGEYPECSGIPFRYNDLSEDQISALGDDPQKMLNYLRGERSYEGFSEGDLRARGSVLGDIVNSRVVVAGAPSAPYIDADNPGYSAFRSQHKNRLPVAYVGANDGMLHAFEATADESTGGREIFAYVPSFLFDGPDGDAEKSGLQALSQQEYVHHAYVDATPVIVDVNFGEDTAGDEEWRTVLFGGLGKGGKGIYALDVTSPEDIVSEGTAADTLLWEFTDEDMGFTYGKPIVVKVDIEAPLYPRYTGWAVIIGSGYNNADGIGYFYILKAKSGELIAKIPTSLTAPANDAGLAHLNASIPEFGEYVADAVYGGDLLGNLWRLSLTDLSLSLLAELEDPSGIAQPVTTPPIIEPITGTEQRYVVVGTGKLLDYSDVSDDQQHTIYGFIDGTAERGNYLSIEEIPLSRDMLKDNSESYTDVGGATTYGWYMDLTDGYRMNVEMASGNGFVVFVVNKPVADVCSGDNTANGTSRLFAIGLSAGKTLFPVPYEQMTSLAKEVSIYRSPNSNGPQISVTTEEGSYNSGSPLDPANPPSVRMINWRNIINFEE